MQGPRKSVIDHLVAMADARAVDDVKARRECEALRDPATVLFASAPDTAAGKEIAAGAKLLLLAVQKCEADNLDRAQVDIDLALEHFEKADA